MDETLKKLFYSGVGLLSLTTTKVKETVEGLIRDRKITEEEGKRILDELINKSKGQRQEFEEQFRSFSSKFEKSTDAEKPTEKSAEEEIEALRKRIAILEERLNISSEEAGKASSSAYPPKENKAKSPGEKVQQNERVSLGDEVLTPEKKMEAEKQRMQEQDKKENEK